MRRSGLVGLLVVAAMAAMVGVSQAPARTAPEEQPIASCQGRSNLDYFLVRGDTVAQTFTAEKSGRLTTVEVRVYDFGGEAGLVMEIRTVGASGAPTQTVLASTTIPASQIGSGRTNEVTGIFDPGVEVEAGQQYALVLRATERGLLVWRGAVRNPCPGGQTYFFDRGGIGHFPGDDVFFSAFGTPSESDDTCTKTGTNKGDVLRGTPRDDVICGFGGGDVIRGRGGDDTVRGGGGDDTERGGGGDDTLRGGGGDDVLNTQDGVRGNDLADGGSGRDVCVSNRGDQTISCI
jgi:Ca2+-binding RTX toxin-like protein